MMFRITTLVKVLFVLKAIFLVSLICLKLELFTFGEKVGLAETEKKENLKEASVENPKKKPRSLMEKLLKLQPLDRTKGSLKQIGKYLDMADKRREEVNARINLLEKQIQSLRKIEKAVTNKISAVEEEKKYIKQMIQSEKKIQKERLDHLVDLYVKMDPKKAAKVFETLDKDLVVGLMKKMKRKTVTEILAFMPAPKSVELTEYFGRIGSAREYQLLKELNVSLSNEFKEAFSNCKKG